MVGAAPLADPVSEFCAKLDELRAESGADVPLLARRLDLSRAQLYAILAGKIKRPPDWDRIVRPLVDACTGGDPAALAAWRQRHAVLTGVWDELRRRDRRAAPVGTSLGPRELPPAAAHFTGRTHELATLTGLLDSHHREVARTVLISAIGGTAGVGKTALAVHWAHQVAASFPDGQLYVNLHGYDPAQPVPAADALARFLRSLGVSGEDIPPEEDERAARYRSRLAGKRVLVVLDNASSAEQVRPLLPGNPACAVLVTSRDTLAGLAAADGAWRLDLGLLPLTDAAALLQSLIGGQADDPEAVTELARLCAQLPLALRIAAELAVSRRPAPLRELTAELTAHRLESLDAGEDRADIRAVFSWSCRHLPDGVARTFALIGLHPGDDLDVHAAAALTGTTAGQARRAMSRLHQASLIQASGPGRYTTHDLLRAYAREQAAALGTDGARHQALTRLFDYYLAAAAAAMDLAFPAGADQRPRIAAAAGSLPAMAGPDDARAWLDQERVNLAAAVVHSAGNGWPEHAADLAATIHRYLLVGGHLPEAETIYRHTLQAARLSGDLAAEASALAGIGNISGMRGQSRDAACHYQDALKLYRRCGDRAGEARVLNNLGIVEFQLQNYRAAAGYYGEAIAAYEDAGLHLGGAGALCNQAGAEISLGLLDLASGHLQLALQVFRDEQDPQREAEALTCIGELNKQRGDLTQAAAFFEQALALYRRIGQPGGIAAGLNNLGGVSVSQGDYQQAISCLGQALVLYRQGGDQHGEIIALRDLAEALHGTGQAAAARAELATALSLAIETGNVHQQASTHRDLAESHHHDGHAELARYHWQQALTLYTQLGAAEADDIRSRLTTREAASQVRPG